MTDIPITPARGEHREPTADDRLESLAEAAGVYLPAYEASLPPEMRLAVAGPCCGPVEPEAGELR